MKLFPAIDIRGGKCVRLLKGDFDQETVFSDSPADMAVQWESQGAEFLHLVDLDGARAGKPQNLETVKAILAKVKIPVELGGGIRTLEDIKEVLGLGVRRVILGSVAVHDPALVKAACEQYGDRVVVGIDAKEGMVAAANMTGHMKKMTDFFASKSTMSFLGIHTMSLGTVTPPDDSYRVDTYDKNGVYKKVVSKDGVIVGALLQGDLAYGGVLQQMIARKIDVTKVKKPLFEIDYSDFFHEKANLEFAYEF